MQQYSVNQQTQLDAKRKAHHDLMRSAFWTGARGPEPDL